MEISAFIRKDFAALEPYSPVQPLPVLAKELGIPVDDLAKLDANENLYGPISEVQTAIATASGMHIYPDPAQTSLRTALSGYLGVPSANIVAGCGSDELLDLLIRVTDPPAVITCTPTFGMYSFLSKICKVPVIDVPRGPAPDFAVDAAGIAAASAQAGPGALLFLASPNNPTGLLAPNTLLAQLAALPLLIVADEAYAEFTLPPAQLLAALDSGAEPAFQTALPIVALGAEESQGAATAGSGTTFENVVVLRTFSKWAGLAGARVGALVAHVALVAAIAAIKQPYNVTVASDAAAQAALAHRAKIFRTQVVPMLIERERMVRLCATAAPWLSPQPTDSNFVLFKVAPPFDASQVRDSLRRRGVLIRYYPKGPLAGYIRISAGRPADTARLLWALQDIAFDAQAAHTASASAALLGAATPPPHALLLDMDGVLVDVARSYRAAIIQTAAAHGVTVTPQDIDTVKAAGNANNDWIVSHRLIKAGVEASGGEPPSLQTVTDTFESIYHGTAGAPPGTPHGGLKSLETPLVSTALLAELSKRSHGHMAVVTGRPRADAEEAIVRFGWQGLFAAVVTMESGPAKPDPSPLNIAMAAMFGAVPARSAGSPGWALTPGGGSILMLGDTVDDMLAAKAAGAVGVGILTPDKAAAALQSAETAGAATSPTTVATTPRPAQTASLFDAGAAVVLPPGFAALLDVLAPWQRPSLTTTSSGDAHAISGSAAATGVITSAPGGLAGAATPRTATVSRETKETSITVALNLDGSGTAVIKTGIGFLDHMLHALAKHGRLDLSIQASGDTWIDDHHTAEDVAIVLGEALDQALGARKDIKRWGMAHCPLDEALARAVVDISSRPWADINLQLQREAVGQLSCEMIPHVLHSLATSARICLHVDVLKGNNDHHRAEAAFKAVGVALRQAVAADVGSGVPSTKGVLA